MTLYRMFLINMHHNYLVSITILQEAYEWWFSWSWPWTMVTGQDQCIKQFRIGHVSKSVWTVPCLREQETWSSPWKQSVCVYMFLSVWFFTPPRNRGGVIFSLQFVCLCVCVSVCLSVCEQNADWTDTPILTRSSLNSCLPHWLEPYWNW